MLEMSCPTQVRCRCKLVYASTHQHVKSSSGNAGVKPAKLLVQLLFVLLAGVAGPDKPDSPGYQRQSNSACQRAPDVGDGRHRGRIAMLMMELRAAEFDETKKV